MLPSSRFLLVTAAAVVAIGLVGCPQRDSKRPQDKKLQQQQRKLDMAIQRLENKLDQWMIEGKRAYDRAAVSVQEFSRQAAQQADEFSRSAEQLVEQSEKLKSIPRAVEQQSNAAVEAAQTAVGYVQGTGSKTPKPDEARGFKDGFVDQNVAAGNPAPVIGK